MKTLTNRTNEKFTFLTVVFDSIEEAEKNCDDNMGECVSRLVVEIHGESGFVVKNADGFKEMIRIAA